MLTLSTGYNDTEFMDDTIGQEGDRLPLTPRLNGVLGFEYQYDLAGHEAFVRADYSYRGDFYVNVGGINTETSTVDSYTRFDMRAGVRFEQMSVEIYGTNLADDDAVTTRWGFGTDLGFRMPPRTLGLEVSYRL